MKRPRDVFDTPASSQASSPPMPDSKRRHFSRTDAVHSSPAISCSTPYTLPGHAPSSPWAFTIPHDSPSNPFGLNRALRALTLPRPSGFGKHVVLRMQIVSQVGTRTRSRRAALDAPFRIVQVPLNYSFRLLHMLILFLFASDAHLRVRRRRRVFSPSLHPHQPPPPPRKSKAELDVLGESPKGKEEDHLFEVFVDVSLYAITSRPGVIRPGSGKLYARLSSARERRLFPEDGGDDEDDVFGGAAGKSRSPFPEEEGEEEEGWDWEAEDDFILSNLWTDGPDLRKGIIYHHTPSTLIHLSANQTRVPPRKGTGNTPYVFTARGGTNGAVRIANVASAPIPARDDGKEYLNVKVPTSRKSKSKSKRRSHKDADESDSLSEDDFDEVDDLDDGEEASADQLERWNVPDAFRRFLKREAAREHAMRRHPDTPPSPLAKSFASAPSSRLPPPRRGNILIPASSPLPGAASSSSSYRRRGPQHPYGYAQPHAAASSSSSLALSSPSTLPGPLAASDFDFDFDGDGDTEWSGHDTDAASGSEGYDADDADGEDMTERVRAPPVYQIQLPLQTPFPTHPAARRRVARASKRLERQTSKGLSELSDNEEEEAEEAEHGGAKKGKGKDMGKGKARAEEAKASMMAEVAAEADNEEDEGGNGEDATVKRAVEPPLVAAQGPTVTFARGREEGNKDIHEDQRDNDDEEEEEEEEEEKEENSEDEGWDVGPMWGFVSAGWDSEDEM